MWVYDLLTQAGFLSDSDHCDWVSGFVEHGRFLFRHLERYSSPYNHLVGEASALFALGVLFPEVEEASRWTGRGRAVLEGDARRPSSTATGDRSSSRPSIITPRWASTSSPPWSGRRRGVELSERRLGW